MAEEQSQLRQEDKEKLVDSMDVKELEKKTEGPVNNEVIPVQEVVSEEGKGKGRKNKVKGKKSKAGKKDGEEDKFLPSGLRATPQNEMRENGMCSNCGNSLRQTVKLNPKDVKGLPENAKAILCDDCERLSQRDGPPVDIRTAIVKNADGYIRNVPVRELVR